MRFVSVEKDTTHPESALLQIGLWANVGNLYPALETTPYTPAPHGPAYYETLRVLARLSHGQYRALALRARILSLGAFFTCAVLASLISYRLTSRIWASTVAGLMVFTQPICYGWSATTRPDMIALAFSLGALLCFCWKDELQPRTVFVAGLLAGFAALYKQSFLSVTVTIVLALLVTRRWSRLIPFVSGLFLVPVGLLGVLLANKEPVLYELLLMRYFKTDFPSSIGIVGHVLHSPEELALISLGGCGTWLLSRKADLRSRGFVFYTFISFILSFLAIQNVGASANYLIEPLTALTVAASVAMTAISARWKSATGEFKLVFLLFLTIALSSLASSARQPVSALPPQLLHLVANKHVLSDQPYFSVHGQGPEMLDPYTTTQLELRGKWSSLPLRQEISRREFDLVMVRLAAAPPLQADHVIPRLYRGYRFFSDPVFLALQENYRPVCFLPDQSLLMLAPPDQRYSAVARDAAAIPECSVFNSAIVVFDLTSTDHSFRDKSGVEGVPRVGQGDFWSVVRIRAIRKW